MWASHLNRPISRSPSSRATLAEGLRMSSHQQLLLCIGRGFKPWPTLRRLLEEISSLEGYSGFINSASVPIALEDLGAYRRRALRDRSTDDPARRSGERLARRARRHFVRRC